MPIEFYVKGAVVGVNGGPIDANPYDDKAAAHADRLVGRHVGLIAKNRMLASACQNGDHLRPSFART